MHFKIRQGTTASSDEDLCRTCINSTVIRYEYGEDYVRCAVLKTRMDKKVVECSAYRHRNQPVLSEMQEIAWILRTDPKKNKIGFVPNKQAKEEKLIEQYGDDIYPDRAAKLT